jgi:CRISPR-associated protein Csc3
MNFPNELVSRYARFYRPIRKKGRISSRAAVRPLEIASKILLHPDNTRMDSNELVLSIAAECFKLMQRIHSGTTEGLFVTNGEDEKKAIKEFSRFFVEEYFLKACHGRHDILSGNKFALVLHTCEFIISDYKWGENGI